MKELMLTIRKIIGDSLEVDALDVKDLKVTFNVNRAFDLNCPDASSDELPKRRGRKPGVKIPGKRGRKPGTKYKKHDGEEIIPSAGADPLF